MSESPIATTAHQGTEARASRLAYGAGLVLVALLFLLWVPDQQPALFPLRIWLAACGALVSLGAWRSRDMLLHRRGFLLASTLFAASIAIPLAPSLLAGERSGYLLAQRLVPPLLGWAFFLLLPIGTEEIPAGRTARSTLGVSHPFRWGIAIGAFSFVAATCAHSLLQGAYAPVNDEVLYLLQAQMLTEPGYARLLDSALVPFFQLKQTIFLDGRFFTQYTPGWPALLAAFDGIGLRWWAPIVFTALTVFFTWRLGVKVHSHAAGLVAAALMATSQYVVLLGGSYFPHMPVAALVTGAALFMLAAEEHHGRAAVVRWLAAGLLLGIAVAVRPLSGVAIGLSLTLWILLRNQPRGPRIAAMGVALAIGALPIGVAMLHYNDVMNGDPLLFGYSLAHDGYQDLGFGIRGRVHIDQNGERLPDIHHFTPALALRQFLDRVHELALRVPPFFAFAPVLLIAAWLGFRVRWRAVLPFLALPFAHFFYFYTSARFYVELFPFLFLALALLCTHILERQRYLGRIIVATLILAQLILTAQNIHRVRADREVTFFPLFRTVLDAREREGPVLIFVRDRTIEQPILEALAWFSIRDHTGDIVIARDLGDRNRILMERLPDHTAFRLAPETGTSLVPVSRAVR